MATLGNIKKISDNITSAKAKPVKALYTIVFGDEAARLNRNKLKKFNGFAYEEDSEEFNEKLNQIVNMGSADLVSVCHILNLSYNGSNEEIARRILTFLCELKEEDNDEEEEEEYEEEDNNPGENNNEGEVYVAERTPFDQTEEITNCMTDMMIKPATFALSFRDVEDSIRRFNGKDGYPINKWLNDFEETAQLMNWNNLQKLIFAKKSLDGLAKLLVQAERGITSWEKLKKLLQKEFEVKVNSADVHELLMNRKKRKDETVQEYIIVMREIGSRANVEVEVIIQYIIRGIPDDNSTKMILYGATSFEELKKKVKLYEEMKSKATTEGRSEKREGQLREKGRSSQSRTTNETRGQKATVRCFSCGERGHWSNNCPKGAQGPKCFKCNKYGHKALNCKADDVKIGSVSNIAANPLNNMKKNILINEVPVYALIDTGSQVNLINQLTYQKIGSPTLHESTITLTGFARGSSSTRGYFECTVTIDDDHFNTNMYVVENSTINNDAIIGAELLTEAEININREEIRVKRRTEVAQILNIHGDNNDEIDIGENMTKTTMEEVKTMISTYAPNKTKISPVQMKIILKEDKPISCPPRRLPFIERDIVDKQVHEWIKEGIVEVSTSEYASPVVLTRKKGGEHRLCIDYRKINKIIIKDRYPLPLIEDILDKLQESKVFSSIDLKNGFFHVNVAPESKQYTAFITHQNVYQFNKMPFGLCNSPAVFQKFINDIFRELINRKIALPYIDDLIILARDEAEAVQRLKMVLQTASEYGLQINKKKCHLLKRKIEFLGYVIEDGKISPSTDKTKAVKAFPEPKTLKQIQSFLGLTGYFRKFIPSYSIIAKPLSDLMRKDKKFQFEEPQKRAFDALKMMLSQKPVLKIFQEEGELQLHTDASSDGYGAILIQKSAEDNEFHPIYYYSKKTSPAESKYSSYELEILAVVKALEKFRIYLLGREFKIITDCSAFQQTMSKATLVPRIARWALFLEQFNYTIEHRIGTKMKHVDALSRYAVNLIEANSCSQQIKACQEKDTEMRTIRELLKTRPYEDYLLKDEILYKHLNSEDLLCIPKAMQTQILEKVHGERHLNKKKMEQIIRKDYYIPKLTNKIENYVANCIPCILTDRKRGKQEGFLHPLHKEEVPLYTYHVDHAGPLETTNKNYNHVLVIIDAFTKFVWLYPVKSTTTREVISKLEIQKQTFGNPAVIITDQGTSFTSKEFNEYCENEAIEHYAVTTGLPRANGQVEKINSSIAPVLTKLSLDDPTKWYKHVGRLQRILNSTFSRSIRMTPFELLTGTPMRNKEDLKLKEIIEQEMITCFEDHRDELRKKAKEQIVKVQQENCKTFNKKRKQANTYQLGDLVAIKRTQIGPGSKLRCKYFGPYRISKVKQKDTYDVIKEGVHEGPYKTKTCAEFLKPWIKDNDSSGSEEDTPPEAVETQDGRAVGLSFDEDEERERGEENRDSIHSVLSGDREKKRV